MNNKKYLITDFVIGEKIYIECKPWTLSDGVTKINKDDKTCYHIGTINKFDGPRVYIDSNHIARDIISLPKTEKEFNNLMKTLKLSHTYTSVKHLCKMDEVFAQL